MKRLLKNSLTNILNEKDTSPSMVNLSNLNINGKAKPVQNVPKTRSSKAVVATVNGHKILKKEADAHLKGAIYMVVGNKTDLEKERLVSAEEGAKFAKKFLADYHETSVKLNAGVDDTFTAIAKKIVNKAS